MLIPKNHEKLQTISDVFKEEMEKHEATGGVYYDDRSAHIAGYAIQTIMPELAALQQQRIIVEAHSGIALGKEHTAAHEGVRVEARLERVSIEVQISELSINGLSDQIRSHDLFAVLRPRYIDPEPQDIVFGDELVVPFSHIQRFEAA